jgi:hypothetical protein
MFHVKHLNENDYHLHLVGAAGAEYVCEIFCHRYACLGDSERLLSLKRSCHAGFLAEAK